MNKENDSHGTMKRHYAKQCGKKNRIFGSGLCGNDKANGIHLFQSILNGESQIFFREIKTQINGEQDS